MKKSELREIVRKVVESTKKATVKKEGLWANINAKRKAGKKSYHKNSNAYKDAKKAGQAMKEVTKEDIKNLVVGLIYEAQGKEILTEKDDRCTRIAKRKYDTWPSAYASGAVVRCRRGEIWKEEK